MENTKQIKKEINKNIGKVADYATIYNNSYDVYELNNNDFVKIFNELMAVEVFANSYNDFFCDYINKKYNKQESFETWVESPSWEEVKESFAFFYEEL